MSNLVEASRVLARRHDDVDAPASSRSADAASAREDRQDWTFFSHRWPKTLHFGWVVLCLSVLACQGGSSGVSPSPPVEDASRPDTAALKRLRLGGADALGVRAGRVQRAQRASSELLGGLGRGLYGMQAQPILRFVHMTDVELGFPDAEARYAVVLEELRAIRPAPSFVVVTGDLTHSGRGSQIKAFKEGLESLEMPVFVVPGNHDISFHPRSKDLHKFRRAFRGSSLYRQDVGPLALIGFDSQLMNIRHRPARYIPCCVWGAEEDRCEGKARERVRHACRAAWQGSTGQRVWTLKEVKARGKAQIVEACSVEPVELPECVRVIDPFMATLEAYQWAGLEELMKDARLDGQRVLLVHHIPPVAKVAAREVKRQWRASAKKKLRRLQRYYPVEAHLVGHFHQDEVRFFDGVPVLVAPPVSPKYDRQSSLRLFSVWPEGLSYEQIYVGVGASMLSYRRDLRGLSGESEVARVKEVGLTAAESMDFHWRRYAAPKGFEERWERTKRDLYYRTLAWEVDGEPDPPR